MLNLHMTKIIEFVKNKTKMSDSFVLALIYSIGHVLIAMSVVRAMTGASLWASGLVALIEPSINAVWLYILHRSWVHFNK